MTSFNANSLIAPNVTAAMLVERIIAKTFFWEFDSIIMQNLSYIFLLFWHQHGRLITCVHSKNREFKRRRECTLYRNFIIMKNGDDENDGDIIRDRQGR